MYHGVALDLKRYYAALDVLAQQPGVTRETYGQVGDCPLVAFRYTPKVQRGHVYLSAGIHGDEPAGPLGLLRWLQSEDARAEIAWDTIPLLNPRGMALKTRDNPEGIDLNRDYRHPKAPETKAHLEWLQRNVCHYDLTIQIHEDWESSGFYVYEMNLDDQPSIAEDMLEAAGAICGREQASEIDGRPAVNGLIRPSDKFDERLDWPESIWLMIHRARWTYTLEAPSSQNLGLREEAHFQALRAGLRAFEGYLPLK